MNRQALESVLQMLDTQQQFVFSVSELQRWFDTEPLKTFKESLGRHIKNGLLVHACRGVYWNPRARSKDAYLLEHIAKTLRVGEYNYVSLESLLSEAGVISQVPLSRLTVMTTGRSQIFKTPYGTIEFTHTHKSIIEILKGTAKLSYRPLRVAKVQTAIKDLKRVNRNVHLIDMDEADDAEV